MSCAHADELLSDVMTGDITVRDVIVRALSLGWDPIALVADRLDFAHDRCHEIPRGDVQDPA